MLGLWHGTMRGEGEIGDISGLVLMFIDQEIYGRFIGRLSFVDEQHGRLLSSSQVVITIEQQQITGQLSDFVYFHRNGKRLHSEELNSSSFTISTSGEISGQTDGDKFTGNWRTNLASGVFEAQRIQAKKQPKNTRTLSWEAFKNYLKAFKKENPDTIFRGVPSSKYNLVTSFHRTGRVNLHRYIREDIETLCYHLNSVCNHRYDHLKIEDLGPMLYLAQHHGFPTPLLDWTESPYIAAFFAFEGLAPSDTKGHASIYLLNRRFINNYIGPFMDFLDPRPVLNIPKFMPFNNNRALPQQSVVTFSNFTDIEYLCGFYESVYRYKFLTKINIPKSSRKAVMADLRDMGITAASLFPGLDGTCRSLKNKLFMA